MLVLLTMLLAFFSVYTGMGGNVGDLSSENGTEFGELGVPNQSGQWNETERGRERGREREINLLYWNPVQGIPPHRSSSSQGYEHN